MTPGSAQPDVDPRHSIQQDHAGLRGNRPEVKPSVCSPDSLTAAVTGKAEAAGSLHASGVSIPASSPVTPGFRPPWLRSRKPEEVHPVPGGPPLSCLQRMLSLLQLAFSEGSSSFACSLRHAASGWLPPTAPGESSTIPEQHSDCSKDPQRPAASAEAHRMYPGREVRQRASPTRSHRSLF